VSDEYKDRGVAVVGIFVEDTDAKAREFVRAHKIRFPSGADWRLALARPLGYRGMPYTVVISPKGEVARKFTGPMPKADLVATIEDLLKQRK
jgi:peroxiredoxin